MLPRHSMLEFTTASVILTNRLFTKTTRMLELYMRLQTRDITTGLEVRTIWTLKKAVDSQQRIPRAGTTAKNQGNLVVLKQSKIGELYFATKFHGIVPTLTAIWCSLDPESSSKLSYTLPQGLQSTSMLPHHAQSQTPAYNPIAST